MFVFFGLFSFGALFLERDLGDSWHSWETGWRRGGKQLEQEQAVVVVGKGGEGE